MSGYIPQGFPAAETAYDNALAEANSEMASLRAMVQLIDTKDGGKMSTDQLFAYVTETVMNQMMNAKGSSTVGVFGAKLQLQNVCSDVMNKMVGDLNYLLKNTYDKQDPNGSSAAKDLSENMVWLQSEVTSGTKGGPPSWMDQSTATSISQSCHSFVDRVDSLAERETYLPFTGNAVLQAMSKILSAGPNDELDGGTASENEKDLTSDLNTAGSAVSSSSSILTSQLQNEMGAMGQIAGAWQSVLQSLVTFENSTTAAMKGS